MEDKDKNVLLDSAFELMRDIKRTLPTEHVLARQAENWLYAYMRICI